MLYLSHLSTQLGIQVFIKMELNNIGGSVKDRTAKEIILKAIERGELAERGTLIEGTSGSTGIALSLIANVKNIKSKIILPDNLAQEKYRILELFNAELIRVPPRNFIDEENYMRFAQNYNQTNGQTGQIKAAQENTKKRFTETSKARKSSQSEYFCDQFDNFDNFWVHYNETGPEIFEQMSEKVDFFVCSSGTGGTIAGVSRYLKEKNPFCQTVLADCEGSSLFSHVNSGVLHTVQEKEINKRKTPDYTVVEGIGQNRLTKNYLRAKIDRAVKVSDLETMHMSHYLIQNEGLFVGGSTCLNLVAVCKLAMQLKKEGKSLDISGVRVVTLANDSGYRYLSKFYNPEYVKRYGITFTKQESYEDLGFIKDF